MPEFNLLDAVLSSEGRFCVVGIGRYVDQKFVDTREELDTLVEDFKSRKVDTFFGCAKYGALDNRKHENAKHFKALWMDIDCGEKKAEPDENGRIKGYIDQATGIDELQRFCTATGLRRPILVNSGNGLHVYWLLSETIDRIHWEALASRLRELCFEHKLIVDPAVFEASRILRIPGTFNYKTEPLLVEVMSDKTEPYTYDEIKTLLGAPEPKEEVPDFIPRRLSPLMETMMGNKVKRFKTIMIRSANGDGCAQLLHCYENQDTIEYDLWRSALSIARYCVDRDMAIHRMSENHPDYDPIETAQKADDIGGPHMCKTFEKLNPNGCDGCKHKGVISTPILLGTEIAEADEADNIVTVMDDDGEVEEVRIPAYPEPYFRGKNGGVYRRVEVDGEEDAQLVYEHDFYVVKRMFDKEVGEVVMFRLHLPQDGAKEFTIPLTAVMAKDKLRDELGYHGIVAFPKQQDAISYFVGTFVKNLQLTNKAEIMRTQFGWADNNSAFIVGDREITKDGSFYSPPSKATTNEAAMMKPTGTFEKWKEVFNLYGLPGLEPHAFAALTAFGAPLLKFVGLRGAIINLIHQSSGSGKSTALYMCNSVWGHPVDLASIWKDTQNAKMHRLGVYNNLPNTIDEITNTSPTEFSDLAYSISQGRGKNRMKAQSNEIRINNTSWQNMTLTSSNASFYQKLGAAKDSPDGESMRLIEYEIKPTDVISVARGKEMFDRQLLENYGHAGDIYAKYLVDNLEDVKALIAGIQAKIDRDVKFTARERFWSGVCACNIAGGLIAKSLGLHDFDMKCVYQWLLGMLSEMREEIKPPQSNPLTLVGEFINNHIHNALVVNDEIDSRSSMGALPLMEPRGELLLRFEPDTKMLYIVAKRFKDFCVKAQINYKDLLKDLETAGVYKDSVNKRMSKGMKMVSPPVRALLFDTTTSEFLQVLAQDENRADTLQD